MPSNKPTQHRTPESEAKTPDQGRGKLFGRRNLIKAGLGIGAIIAIAKLIDMSKPEGPGGAEILADYDGIPDQEKGRRHKFVLCEIAMGHVPDHYKEFEEIEIKSKTGNKVLTVEAAKHGLRLGHDDDYVEIPLDGFHAMAAAELMGYHLSTKMISEAIRAKAFATGGKVKFIDGCVIATALGTPKDCGEQAIYLGLGGTAPNGKRMESTDYVVKSNELLMKWRAEHGITEDQVTTGYFKEIILDEDQAVKTLLATYPGYGHEKILDNWRNLPADDPLNLVAARHDKFYFDYSHLARLIRNLKLDGKPIDFWDFHTNKDHAKDFGFTRFDKAKNHYQYEKDKTGLKKFMDEEVKEHCVK